MLMTYQKKEKYPYPNSLGSLRKESLQLAFFPWQPSFMIKKLYWLWKVLELKPSAKRDPGQDLMSGGQEGRQKQTQPVKMAGGEQGRGRGDGNSLLR